MKAMNPLSGVQSYQQAPAGIPPALAQIFQQQQQREPDEDQGQLAQYIKQLQDSGASPEQIQDVMQRVQGGDQSTVAPTQEMDSQGMGQNSVQGGTGTDTMGSAPNVSPEAAGANPQSPMSQALNQMASGQGGINYDQVQGAYPTPRPPVIRDQNSLMAQGMSESAPGLSAGAQLSHGINYAMQQQDALQNAIAQQQNQRDKEAYNATTGLAEKAGNIAALNNKIQMLSDFHDQSSQDKMAIANLNNALGLSKVQTASDALDEKSRHNAAMETIDSLKKQLNRLPEGTTNTISTEIDKQTGLLDAKGKMVGSPPNPINDAQRAAINDAALTAMRADPNLSAAGAVTAEINKLGGKDSLVEQTKPRTGIASVFNSINPWSDASTGYRMFPNVAQQSATPGVAAAPNMAPPVASTAPQSSATPDSTVGTVPSVLPSGGRETHSQPAMPQSVEDFQSLPSGARYINPRDKSMTVRIKP